MKLCVRKFDPRFQSHPAQWEAFSENGATEIQKSKMRDWFRAFQTPRIYQRLMGRSATPHGRVAQIENREKNLG